MNNLGDSLSVIDSLVSQLGSIDHTARAQKELVGLIRSALCGPVLERLLATEGHGATHRRAVARLLVEVAQSETETLSQLPRMVVFSARALGDAEASVRAAHVEVVEALATHVAAGATAKQVLTLMLRPLLSTLDQAARGMQQGAALAIREAVRALQPSQLRGAISPLCSAVRKHLRASNTHGRPAMLEAFAWLIEALGHELAPQLTLLLPLVLDASVRPDWRERAASVRVFHRLSLGALPMQPAEQGHVTSALATLRYDKVSVVRQAAASAQAAAPLAARDDEPAGSVTPRADRASRQEEAAVLVGATPRSAVPRVEWAVPLESQNRRASWGAAKAPAPAAAGAGCQQTIGWLLQAHERWVGALLSDTRSRLTGLDDRLEAATARVATLNAASGAAAPPTCRLGTTTTPAPAAALVAGRGFSARMAPSRATTPAAGLHAALAAPSPPPYSPAAASSAASCRAAWASPCLASSSSASAAKRPEARTASLRPPSARLPQSSSRIGIFQRSLASTRATPSVADVACAAAAPTSAVKMPRRAASGTPAPRSSVSARGSRTEAQQPTPYESAVDAAANDDAPDSEDEAPLATLDVDDAECAATGHSSGFADDIAGAAPPRWASPPPPSPSAKLASQSKPADELASPASRWSTPPPAVATPSRANGGARVVNAWTPQGWLRSAPHEATPDSSAIVGVSATAGYSPGRDSPGSALALARQLTSGPPTAAARQMMAAASPADVSAARSLLCEGRASEAFEMVWRLLADGEAGADVTAVGLLQACDGEVLEQMGEEQAHAVVSFVAEQLKAERHVEPLLPWLEHALRLRLQGRDLFERPVWLSLTRTLRGLSACADATGIHAAKLSALLAQGSPARKERPAPQLSEWLD